MSLDAVSWAMDQSVGRSAAKLLLVTLAHCVNGKGTDNMVCFPSNAHLAERSELDKKSVTKNMQWLQDRGFLERTGARHGRTGQVLEYRLKEPKSGAVEPAADAPKAHHISPERDPKTDSLQECESTPHFPAKDTTFPPKAHHISPERDPKTDSLQECESTPHFPAKDTTFPQKAHHISPERDPNVVHGTSKEQVKEQVTEQRRVRAKSSNLPDGFAEFWTEYPRKEGRVNALKSWEKRGLHADLSLRKQVMAALAQHRVSQQWTKDGGQFVPHAATWLNQERYLDELRPGAQIGHRSVPNPEVEALKNKAAAVPPEWWKCAGFDTKWDAQSARCDWTNYTVFRDGKRIAEPAEVGA